MQTALDTSHWPQQFLRFAAEECPGRPLYVALCHALAAWPALGHWMALAPAAQARPNLLLAAVHDRVLAGAAHPLASYYPSVGGSRAPDAELPALLIHFIDEEQAAIAHHLRHSATQTNEPGRCAVLRLALDTLAAQLGASTLALYEFGTSAGLNLAVAADALDGGRFQRPPHDRGAARLHLACDWQAAEPPPSRWQMHATRGADINPVDVNDATAARWLQACVWPDDTPRLARLQHALAWARQHPPDVVATTDGLTDLAQWLSALPTGVQPVLVNSWVLAYLSPAERAAYALRVEGLIASHGLAWISAESAAAQPSARRPPIPPRNLPQTPTLWRLHSRLGMQDWCWSHPHGAWVVSV